MRTSTLLSLMLWFRMYQKETKKKKNRFRLQSKRKLPLKKKLPFILVEKKMDQKKFREFRLEIHRTEKDGDLCIYPQFLENISHKNAHKKRKEKFSKNFKLSIHNVASTGTNLWKKVWLFMWLLAVLGSQGIVVKCTAAIFFRTVDCGLRFEFISHESKLLNILSKRTNKAFCLL